MPSEWLATQRDRRAGAATGPLGRGQDQRCGGWRRRALPGPGARRAQDSIFDANAADITKSIKIPDDNFLLAASGPTLVMAYRNRNLFDRYDLETMALEEKDLRSPIQARLLGLAMGSDSNRPLLVAWSPEKIADLVPPVRYRFVDPKTLSLLKAGPITKAPLGNVSSVSPSRGSVTLSEFLRDQTHVRASAGGSLFAIWAPGTGLQTLAVRGGAALRNVYDHGAGGGYLAPGPDGHRVYTDETVPKPPDPPSQEAKKARAAPSLSWRDRSGMR